MHLIIFIAQLPTEANASAMNIIKCISGPRKCFACIVPDHHSQSEWVGLQASQCTSGAMKTRVDHN